MKNIGKVLRSIVGIGLTTEFSSLEMKERLEVGRKLRDVLHNVVGVDLAGLMNNVLKDDELRQICELRGITTLPLKVEDIKKELKTEPTEEPLEEPTDDIDIYQAMAELEANTPKGRGEIEAHSTIENNNGEEGEGNQIMSMSSKTKNVINLCLVCDEATGKKHKMHFWHFMAELKDIILTWTDPNTCAVCGYSYTPKNGNPYYRDRWMAKHLALQHSTHDEFFLNTELIQTKRDSFKKELEAKRVRESATVMAELEADIPRWENEIEGHGTIAIENNNVKAGPRHQIMSNSSNSKNMILAAAKVNQPNGNMCTVCDGVIGKKQHIWHFIDELRDIILTWTDPNTCEMCGCSYTPKNGNFHSRDSWMAKHLAFRHSKLDEFLLNTELVQKKRDSFKKELEANRVRESAIIFNPCPICDSHVGKRNRRIHVMQHFMDELKAIAFTWTDPHACEICHYYTNERIDKIAKHLALGHSKIDVFLRNPELVKAKRDSFKTELKVKVPKRKRVQMETDKTGLETPLKVMKVDG